MSEQAKLALLIVKLNDIRKTRRNLAISVIVIAVMLGVVGNLVGVDFLVLMTIAVGLMVVGLFTDSQYAKQEATIRWEIQQMATLIPKCSSCGKEVPQGNFEFCPFCGNQLKRFNSIEKSENC